MRAEIASSPNVNTLWARALIDELARCGVRYAVISPGSRSTPLALAAFEHPDIADISILDERSAAYFALGIGKHTRVPAVLICTSGTAAANYFPAVCEAHAARVPLLVLTADRPPHLFDTGAPQTMDQQRLYGAHARWFAQLPQPEANELALRALRSTASYAYAQAVAAQAGPVHLNILLDKPLEPTEVPEGDRGFISGAQRAAFGEGAFGRRDGKPFTRYEPQRSATLPDTGPLLELLGSSSRPLIIAGPDPEGGEYADALIAFAERAGIPVFAEGISNVRFINGEHPLVIGSADLMLRSEGFRAACKPDFIIRTGAAPTNKMMQDFAAFHADVPQVQIGPQVKRTDPEFVAVRHILAEPKALFERTLHNSPHFDFEGGWSVMLTNAAAVARTVLSEAVEGSGALTEPAVFYEIASLLPAGAAVMLGNSMPVRDWETYAQPAGKLLHCYCNRGVNGIDGVTSTALGIARARGARTLLITGDLSFLHDINALWTARSGEINATIVVINNNGGEIFSMLPVRKFEPPFAKHFTTAHNLELSKAGELFGIEYYKAMNAYQLQTFLNISLDAPGLQIIEIPTKSESGVRKQIAEKMAAELDVMTAGIVKQPASTRAYPLHFHRAGETGESDSLPALLLHGFTRSSASWEVVAAALPAERDVYLADLMGHGASPAPEFEAVPEAYTLAYQSARLEEGIAQYGVERMHLAGYSMGGRAALLYALEHPERIASLTLLSASPGIEDESARAVRAASDRALADGIQTGGLEQFVSSWSASDVVAGGLGEPARAAARADRLRQSASGLRGSLLGMGQGVQPSLWDRLHSLDFPVLLVYGALDTKYAQIMGAMAERIPNARLHIFESAGHDIVSAAPEELAALLAKFWDACDAPNR